MLVRIQLPAPKERGIVMEVKYFVGLGNEYENVEVEIGHEKAEATVTIPIEKLFLLALGVLRNGVARDYVSEDILADIHDYL